MPSETNPAVRMSHAAPEPPLTTTMMLPDCADASSALLATPIVNATTTATTATAATTRNEEETPPPSPPPAGVEHKSRYLLRNRQGHTASADVAGVASVVEVYSNQTTPTSASSSSSAASSAAAAAAVHPFASLATTSTPSQQQQSLRRSKRKAANPVTPDKETASFFLTTQQTKKPKSTAAAAAARQNKKNKNTTYTLPLPSLRTESFQALTPQNCIPPPTLIQQQQPIVGIVPHTLILGTHPSIKSLQQDEYYSHSQNAFWWIAGDCLGFRRDTGISESTGKPFALTSALRYDKILTYPQQMERLIQAGFVLWDVVASCERVKAGNKKLVRMSSMDSDIKNEVPNDIRSFCVLQYPTIRRIVFADGQTGSSIFCKHNKEWLASGELCAGADDLSQRRLAKACSSSSGGGGGGGGKKPKNADDDDEEEEEEEEPVQDANGKIQLIATISVSPAAAKFSYQQKIDWWEKHVYQPGLRDHKDLLLQNAKA